MEGQNRRDTTTVLITGAAGFAGSHLAKECARRGWKVHGTARPGERAENLAAVPEAAIHRCDLSDADAVRTLVEEVQPAQVYHLAAQASVQKAWQDPMTTLTNNIAAQLAILRAVQVTCPQARVLVVSSSEVYGRIDPARLPVNEDAPLGPLDPYAVSKVTQEMLGLQQVGHGDAMAGGDVVDRSRLPLPQGQDVGPDDVAHVREVTHRGEVADLDNRRTQAGLDHGDLAREVGRDEAGTLARSGVIEGAHAYHGEVKGEVVLQA